MRLSNLLATILLIGNCGSFTALAQDQFKAFGVDEPIVRYLEDSNGPVPRELAKVAVDVTFDLLPTRMRFSLPCYPAMVTENDIHFSNGWTETYDPLASSSCEPLWDRDSRYARMWIESQNPARIVVRVRHAIADPDGYIGHSNIPSGSPYGKGDWTDEWYYIYPDGTHTRHVRIYTGLAEQSLTVTDETFQDVPPVREIPPSVVHEFQEDFIFGQDGHLPADDINEEPITFIYPDGKQKRISYKPYPDDYADFMKAPIKVVNLKSEYKPFTISLPYGIENEPYAPEGDLQHTFQTWGGDSGKGYSTSLGHTLNWWHYRRNGQLLEQVYHSGMINGQDLAGELTDLYKSWVIYPRLLMNGLGNPYLDVSYDMAQKAYIVHGDHEEAKPLEFSLGFEVADEDPVPVTIVNPVFVLKNWGNQDVEVFVGGKKLKPNEDYRVGYENTPSGIDLVLWLKIKSKQMENFLIKPQ